MYNENVEKFFSDVLQKQKLDFLNSLYCASLKAGRLKKYFSIYRQFEQFSWMSARGIEEKFECGYDKLMADFFNPNAQRFIMNMPGVDEEIINSLTLLVARDIKVLRSDSETRYKELLDGIKSAWWCKKINEWFGDCEVKETPPAETPEVALEEVKEPEAEEWDSFFTETPEETKEEAPAPIKAEQEQTTPPARPVAVKATEVKSDSFAANFMLNFPIGEILQDSVNAYLNDPKNGVLADVQAKIKEEAQKLQPNNIFINNTHVGQIQGLAHKYFDDALELAIMEKQLFMAGVAGSGKTSLAGQIAKALGLKFAHISCTAGMSEAHLLGRMVANGDYVVSSFVELYENGGVFLFDEVDAADANTMLVINSALANGSLSVPNRRDNSIAHRHKDFYAICAANTWGWGSNEYAGRNILDAAFLDRFAGCKLLIDYDVEMEREICKQNNAPEDICQMVWAVRANCVKHRIRRVVSTRAVVSAVRFYLNGWEGEKFIKVFTTGWSEEETKKATENVIPYTI